MSAGTTTNHIPGWRRHGHIPVRTWTSRRPTTFQRHGFQAFTFRVARPAVAFMNYPNMQTMYQRFGLAPVHADDWLKFMGLAGKMSAGLDFAWERNIVNNWRTTDAELHVERLTWR